AGRPRSAASPVSSPGFPATSSIDTTPTIRRWAQASPPRRSDMAEPYAPLLTRKKLLGGAEESTSGTAATVTTPLANTIVYDIKLELQDVMADNERTPDGLYLGS